MVEDLSFDKSQGDNLNEPNLIQLGRNILTFKSKKLNICCWQVIIKVLSVELMMLFCQCFCLLSFLSPISAT